MKKNLIALIAGAAALCIAVTGCGSQKTQPAPETGTATVSTTASTAAEAATEAAAEEETSWKEDDSAYLSGVKASDYVDLPEDYKKQTVEAAKPVAPTEEEVDERIEAVLQSRGTLKEVDRKVRKWDTVNIDYVGKIDGAEFEGGSGNYDLVIGSKAFIEGFEDGLIGAKKGETLDLDLKFPENYGHTDLAGKDVVFTVTVNKISDYDLSDEFVKSLNITNDFGQAVTDIDAFRDYIRSNMDEEREETYAWTVKRLIDDQLLKTCTFRQDPPASMLESYYFQYYNFLSNAASSNYMDLPAYMQTQYGATADNYDLMIRDFAKQAAQFGLIYQAIADDRDMNPTEEEVRTAIAEYVDRNANGIKADDLERYIREYIRDELMSNRVRDWLFEKCKVTEPAENNSEKTADEGDTAAAAEEDQDGAADTADTGVTSETAEEDNAETAEEDNADTAETSDTAESSEEDGEENKE